MSILAYLLQQCKLIYADFRESFAPQHSACQKHHASYTLKTLDYAEEAPSSTNRSRPRQAGWH